MKEKPKVIGGKTYLDKKTNRHYRVIAKQIGVWKMLCKEDMKAHIMPIKYIEENMSIID